MSVARRVYLVAFRQRAMHDEIGVAPNRAGEMRVVVFRQTVMAERLRGIARALQTFQQPDLERLLLRFAAQRSEQPLQFPSLASGRRPCNCNSDELAIFRQLFRVGIFVDAIDRRDEPVLQLARDRFVRREHEFLDQLMRLVVLDPLEPDRLAPFVEPHFHFREIEVERAVLENAAAEERASSQATCRRSLNWSLGGDFAGWRRPRDKSAGARCG
jgi:hypothetical protein